jgi:hypothetical protein
MWVDHTETCCERLLFPPSSGWEGNWIRESISDNISAWKRETHIPLPRPRKS